MNPGWNVIFVKVSPPEEQLQQLLQVGKISRIVVRTTERGPITADFSPLESENWDDDAYLWSVRDVKDDTDIVEISGALSAGGCYIFRSLLKQPSDPIVLEGKPVYRRQVWRGMDGTLIGGYLDEKRRPSIGVHFAPSPLLGYRGDRVRGHGEVAEFYALEPKEGWRRLGADEVSAEAMNENECLFIRAPGWTDYQGPLEASLEGGDELTFSSDATEQTLKLSNRTNEAMEVELRSPRFIWKGEASRGALMLPALFVRLPERSINSDPWFAVDEEGVSIAVPARGSRHLRLGANLPAAQRWRGEAASDLSSGTDINSILTLKGTGGAMFSIPVSIALGVEPDAADLTGLWAGDVTVDHVMFASAANAGRGTVQPVVRPFRFRILIHRSNDGVCRLLSEAFELRKTVDGEYISLLLSDEGRALALHSKGGTELRRRFGSVAYITEDAIPAEPASTDQNVPAPCLSPESIVTFRIVLEHDDPRHPDIHARHPDHDNLNENFENRLEEGIESNRIERRFTLHFTPPGSAETYSPFWGDARRHGIFEEEIVGIHKSLLKTKGSFELRHVSRADLREEEK